LDYDDVPSVAMVVPLHVIIEVDAQAVIYGLMGNNQWKPKSTMVKIKSFGTWNMNPCFEGTHKIYHRPLKIQSEWRNGFSPGN
jgi:hypothetical protein